VFTLKEHAINRLSKNFKFKKDRLVMEKDLKLIFRNSGITTIIIFIYGLVIGEKSIYIASSLGAILSIWNLYSIYKGVEIMIYLRDSSKTRKMFGYMKRYVISGIFLVLMMKVDIKWFASGILGLLVVKFNILLSMLKEQFNNIAKKLKL